MTIKDFPKKPHRPKVGDIIRLRYSNKHHPDKVPSLDGTYALVLRIEDALYSGVVVEPLSTAYRCEFWWHIRYCTHQIACWIEPIDPEKARELILQRELTE